MDWQKSGVPHRGPIRSVEQAGSMRGRKRREGEREKRGRGGERREGEREKRGRWGEREREKRGRGR